MTDPAKRKKVSFGRRALLLLLKLSWAALVITTPLLGVWGASSLAAYRNGPIWLALLCGLLLFPLLPIGWDLLARLLRARREGRRERVAREKGRSYAPRPRFLTWYDRLILRTLVLNLLFIGGLLALQPQTAFEALSTRGDWFLEGRKGASADRWRRRLYGAADKLEWLYLAVKDNPFRDQLEPTGVEAPEAPQAGDTRPTSTSAPETHPAPTARPSSSTATTAQAGDTDTTPSRDGTDDETARALRPHTWPFPEELHPAVRDLPAEAETDVASVGRYLAEQESDSVYLVKALHDYAADRVAYDAESYVAKSYPPQDAATVFRTRKSVCAGYANLLAALGKAAGAKIVVVAGDARTEGWELSGEGHAWNAAEIDGAWYLLDATWNAGHVNGTTFTKRYRTDYFLTPPEVFGADHLPDDPRWQLRGDQPLSRGDFLRQPLMSPRFHALGFELVMPERSQVSVADSVALEVRNRRGQLLLADYVPRGGQGGQSHNCSVTGGDLLRIHCQLVSDGEWSVRLFGGPRGAGTYPYMGGLEVNASR